tara:strand:- start:1437 stop:1757 length:321 start_codon:yes stop_codon:yes gene_type:complete
MPKKRKVEVNEDDVVIVVTPRLDKDDEWIHETNVHFSKKHFTDEKAAVALSELCRAMVGFSYAANNDDLLFYSGVFYRILEGDFKDKRREVKKKDNIIYLDRNNDD